MLCSSGCPRSSFADQAGFEFAVILQFFLNARLIGMQDHTYTHTRTLNSSGPIVLESKGVLFFRVRTEMGSQVVYVDLILLICPAFISTTFVVLGLQALLLQQ